MLLQFFMPLKSASAGEFSVTLNTARRIRLATGSTGRTDASLAVLPRTAILSAHG